MGHAKPQAAPNIYGRYETLFRIASGGMAEVYAARVRGEAGFQKLVALKRMLPHLTDDERFVTMFMDEGRLAANISSPNVVSTLDLGRADDDSLYLVMELVVGTTLSNLLRNAAKDDTSVPIDVGVEMIAQAAQGLHDAHEARTPFGAPLHIVHRDVSPQNILVGTDGRVRITDFGVARAIMRRTKTNTGEFKGKLAYFSPEQCADKDIDRRSDVFSLGVVAWETLTTRRLFHAENPLAVLERVTRMAIPSADSVQPGVPAEVAAVVAKALERNRDARYASGAEFARALRDAARATVGATDLSGIAALVAKHGGEGLARVQDQLRLSLSERTDAAIALPPADDTKTEISSGIVFRSEDGAVSPATPPLESMISSTGASFVRPADMPSTQALAQSPSKLPYVIAGLVAALGLAGGVAIGVLAMTARQAPARTDDGVRVLSHDPMALPTSAEPTPAPLPVEEPEAQEPEPQAPASADRVPEPAAPPPATAEARRNPARPPRRTQEPQPIPTPRPLGDSVPSSARVQPPQVQQGTPVTPRPRPGLAGVEGFDRDIGQR